ncbi:hypothetical protein EJ04DRAFT_586405 [Polyplosphaeria fusca]|uniref:Uncharacterized protein n=1 Tax=Polyplosphaeria fusca TaxID=682080 RepID=A0A9P4QT10_9PLEO|nr:hypothetical protein EJ04DRAFT_586405 [Polyplosphaeria fusca]
MVYSDSSRGKMGVFKRIFHKSTSTTAKESTSPTSASHSESQSEKRGMRALLDRLRSKSSKSSSPEIVPSSAQSVQSAQVPKLVVSFVKCLTGTMLSDFLSWFLFHDIVLLPESPGRWYHTINAMDMRGWIALGSFLRTGINLDLELVTLDAICDRLRLPKATVYDCLRQLADPQDMTWTQLASTMRVAKQENMTEAQTLGLVQSKLCNLLRLANHLTPSKHGIFPLYRVKVINRIKEFNHELLAPRLAVLVGSAPKLTTKTPEEKSRLEYLFEAMQQERPVPLTRYGLFPEHDLDIHATPTVTGEHYFLEQYQLEKSFSTISLGRENQALRARNAELELVAKSLKVAKEQLVQQVASLGRVRLAKSALRRGSAPANILLQDRRALQIGLNPIESSRSNLVGHLPAPGSGHGINRPSRDYVNVFNPSSRSLDFSQLHDVFSPLDFKPLPDIPLADPSTKEPFPSFTPKGHSMLPRSHGYPDLRAVLGDCSSGSIIHSRSRTPSPDCASSSTILIEKGIKGGKENAQIGE